MDDMSCDLLLRLFLTGLFLMVVLPLAVVMSWVGITYHYGWGYPVAVLTGVVTLGFLLFLPRFWRGYGHELRNMLFPEYLSPYRPSPRRTDHNRNEDTQAWRAEL
jgi:hypothetical protein